LVQGLVLLSGRRCFLVADEDGFKGMLTLHDIKSVSPQNWGVTQVKEIMTPLNKLKVAHPNQDALSILEEMDENNVSHMPIVSEGRIIGLIARDNLITLIRTRSDLGV